MKKKTNQVSAYMTLEVSLLFPIIVTLLVCVIYLIFYSYNQTMAHQNAAIAALYGKSFSYTEEKESELINRMYEILEKLNSNQYLALSNLKQTVSIENNNIKITQYGSIKIPFINEEIISKMDFAEQVVVDTQNAIFYMRQMRKVKNNED